jgi:hypothetical protein
MLSSLYPLHPTCRRANSSPSRGSSTLAAFSSSLCLLRLFFSESALWTPSSVNVVVYTIAEKPEVKYRRIFENIPDVTPFQTVEVNICDQPAGTA